MLLSKWLLKLCFEVTKPLLILANKRFTSRDFSVPGVLHSRNQPCKKPTTNIMNYVLLHIYNQTRTKKNIFFIPFR